MGAQWKQKGREISALKRGQLFGKLVKEIVVAVKASGPDPDLNARLHAAIETARKNSVPRDTIERAVKKGAGQTGEVVNYELVTYEGFAPGKVPIIIECLTDNRNRTAPEIRVLFKGGQLGTMGSVAWMFEHVGMVEAHHPTAGQDLEAVAIEAGASLGWKSYVGPQIAVIGVDTFGASAPGPVVMQHYGFTVENVCKQTHKVLRDVKEKR